MDSAASIRKNVTASTSAATPLLPRAPARTPGGFVALSRFVVSNGFEAEVKAALRERPHLVNRTAGFVRMEVLCPLDRPQEIWPVTHWRHADECRAWHRGHAYRESHRGIPKGLKLVGREPCIRAFEVVCE
jgi:heme-degrading monooxygenase HmoA